ncbi:MAG: hypothetical protein QXR60_03450 [Candidatus Nanoarchaeia archaeon]
MYEKEVTIGKYKYTYYYHNVKIKGRVRNVCLGRNKGEAKQKLKKIVEESRKRKKPIAGVIKNFWKAAKEEG